MSSDVTLKPCPFCGGDAECSPATESGEPEPEDREPLSWAVGCSCTAFIGPWLVKAEAIAAWNQRHTTPSDPVRQGGEPVADGSRPLPFDRDTLGRMVREAWVRWAETQPNPKPSWLLPYDDLAECDKEADRQIGEAIARWTLIGDAAIYTHPPAQDVAALVEACKTAEAVLVNMGFAHDDPALVVIRTALAKHERTPHE